MSREGSPREGSPRDQTTDEPQSSMNKFSIIHYLQFFLLDLDDQPLSAMGAGSDEGQGKHIENRNEYSIDQTFFF